MIIPPYLKQGDKVAIVSPAKVILPKEIEQATKHIQKAGFEVVLGKNIHSNWNRFAGTDKQRLADIQWALDSPEIRAVFFARGGYGSVRIIDQLDFSQFKINPKWLVGYSDITVFHNHVNTNLNVSTIHATMPLNMTNSELNKTSTQKLLNGLQGDIDSMKIESHKLNREGAGTGHLVGGNLSVFCSLIGTNSDVNTDGNILFIEDLCEELYHLDRMMYQLKKGGKLKKLSGLLVGGFTDMTDVSSWFDKSAYEIIADHVKEFNYPLIFNAPAGHIPLNLPLYIGMKYQMKSTNEMAVIELVD